MALINRVDAAEAIMIAFPAMVRTKREAMDILAKVPDQDDHVDLVADMSGLTEKNIYERDRQIRRMIDLEVKQLFQANKDEIVNKAADVLACKIAHSPGNRDRVFLQALLQGGVRVEQESEQ